MKKGKLKKIMIKLQLLYSNRKNNSNIMKSIIKKRNNTTEEEHLDKIVNKGTNIYVEKGFSVYNGHHNIQLGSNIFLGDVLINAGDDKGKIVIDDYVNIGHRVLVLARNHDYCHFNRERWDITTEKPIHIKEGVWIGSGSIILGNVTIGKFSVVGAGSVVTKDVPDYTIVVGNPAKKIKKISPK